MFRVHDGPVVDGLSWRPFRQLAPETIFFDGKIVTVDKPFTITEAFAVKGDRFVAVGKNAEIRALAGSNTKFVDLQGHTVIPGLLDNESHNL